MCMQENSVDAYICDYYTKIRKIRIYGHDITLHWNLYELGVSTNRKIKMI